MSCSISNEWEDFTKNDEWNLELGTIKYDFDDYSKISIPHKTKNIYCIVVVPKKYIKKN